MEASLRTTPLASPAARSALETNHDDILEFDVKPRESALEKSIASSRLFGQKGKFGGGNALRRRFSRNSRFDGKKTDLQDSASSSPVHHVRRRLSATPDFYDGAEGEDLKPSIYPRSTASQGVALLGRAKQRQPLQRSASLQVCSTRNKSASSLSSHGPSSTSSFASLVEENSNPNFDGPPDLPRERKKIKARRHSFAVAPSTASRQSSSSSGSSNLPPDLQWLAPHMESPAAATHSSAEAFAALSQGSVGSISTTPSHRKRAVTGSPVLSDTDEWLHVSGSSFASSRRSRSRIFSLEESIQPCRGNDDDHMDETSCEESLSSSPDTSMDMGLTTKATAPIPDKSESVLQTMSSIEDLDFLVQELKKSSNSTAIFGSNSWKVVPPATKWSGERRSQFLAWVTSHLGFTWRSAGVGYPYVQISKDRGSHVLQLLETALKTHISSSRLGDKNSPVLKSPFTTMSLSNQSTVPKSEGSGFTTTLDIVAEDLVDRLSSLTFSEPKQAPTPLFIETSNSSFTGRSSIGSSSQMNPRPSLDSQQGMTDLNLEHFGISPRVGPAGRPPKMSFGSWSSSRKSTEASAQAHRMTPCAERLKLPLTSVKFAATPLNKDCCNLWGSRPCGGRDWGTSEACDDDRLAACLELLNQASDSEDSVEMESLNDSSSSSLSLDIADDVFDIEVGTDSLMRREVERNDRRRLSSFNKRKRMSLFATAAGVRVSLPRQQHSLLAPIPDDEQDLPAGKESASAVFLKDERLLSYMFSFMGERQLTTTISAVCTTWAKLATEAHANLLLRSVQHFEESHAEPILEQSWKDVHETFPWACYLAEGGAKRVYRVHNAVTLREEAVSVMDIAEIDNIQIVANELAVTAMLSSFVRRGLCPNFIQMYSVFTAAYAPPESSWGDEENKCPRGKQYKPTELNRKPRKPKIGHPGRYQYISMELVNEGDAEEYIKRQPDEQLDLEDARCLLFQIAFSLFAAADRFSVKHYDVKLLNIFVKKLENANPGGVVLRYGLGSRTFALRMAQESSVIAKLADFGTASVDSASSGQPVAISHFTTLENTPPDFLILGDDAKQGHEHDNFGLGLCMLHLFTGYRPYEEILEPVVCPPSLKNRLKAIWEAEDQCFSVVRSIIFDGVDQDEDGNLIGDPDETFYDAFYRFLVLFGVPQTKFCQKTHPKVWKAITDSLLGTKRGSRGHDKTQYTRDCKRYSIRTGNNKYIARARETLQSVEGGLELLLDLCSFDPTKRATPMQVLNSKFMEALRETEDDPMHGNADVYSYMSFSSRTH